MNFNKKMFITDFDGTFLKTDSSLCKKDIKEIVKIKNKGVITAVATGRSIYSFDLAFARLKLKPDFLDYLIFSTGAGILSYPDKKIIKASGLEKKHILDISSFLEKKKIDHMIHSEIPYTRDFFYKKFSDKNKDFNTRIELYQNYCSPFSSNSDINRSTQVIAILPPDHDIKMQSQIIRGLCSFNIIKTTSPLDNKSIWMEIFPKNVSKSIAASWLAQKTGVKRENILSIGNDYNDEDLLYWSGSSFIVENAPIDLKTKFKTVPSNDCGAVRTAIKNWTNNFSKYETESFT
ncbi:MAG: HAD family hydrolase [Desulforegulaceae bacterium]|nr:HAD family hydrolase [Desulforegulaceae bacterium]